MGTYVLHPNRCSCQTESLSADHRVVTTVLPEPACLEQDETFDRLARLAAKAVQSSAAFVTLADCDADEIVFAGITGVPEIPAGERMPLSQTICRHVVSSGMPPRGRRHADPSDRLQRSHDSTSSASAPTSACR